MFLRMLRQIIVCLVICALMSSCDNYHRNKTHAVIPESRIREGEVLAKKYCQSCHIFPEPSQLDVASWEDGVLPNMGPRLGIFSHNFRSYPSSINDPNLPKGFYPSQPILKPEEWQRIIDYYVSTCPDSLPLQNRKNQIENQLPFFRTATPLLDYDNAAIAFLKIDSTSVNPQIVLSDIRKQQILRFNSLLQLIDTMPSPGSIVDIVFQNGKMLGCDIGVMNPTNGKYGRAVLFEKEPAQTVKTDSAPVFQKLSRPVQITPSDLNLDKKTDYIVCEFGHFIGSLSWMENKGQKKFVRHELAAQPGAIRSQVNDYNNDGLPDIWVLFTQGKEEIVLFTNKGNGLFHSRVIISFPSVHGSTYFELCDFNNDGFSDIVYTCGDNADYSMVLKPYHGCYIYLNDGTNQFSQQYFFPINGCFKAIPRDYDHDGDIDIATIAFFADYARQPEEGFVYLENKGGLKFKAYSFPENSLGRWLTMDAGDVDGDGKLDIVLGNFSIRPSVIPSAIDWKKGPPFVVLKNMAR